MTKDVMDSNIRRILMKNTLPEIRNKLAISQPGTLANAVACASAYELENLVENGVKSDDKLDLKNQLKQIHAKLAVISKDPKETNKQPTETTVINNLESGNKLEETLNKFIAAINNGRSQGGLENRNNRGPIMFNCLHCGIKGHGYARCFKATEEDKKKIRDQQQLKYQALNLQVAANTSH